MVLEYLAADEGSEERDNLEQRYGKGNLMRLVHRYQEEMANKEWLDRSTTECPGCSCRVEKNLGCNHVRRFPPPFVAVTDTAPSDDVLEVRKTLLLPMWRGDPWAQSIRALQPARAVLPEII